MSTSIDFAKYNNDGSGYYHWENTKTEEKSCFLVKGDWPCCSCGCTLERCHRVPEKFYKVIINNGDTRLVCQECVNKLNTTIYNCIWGEEIVSQLKKYCCSIKNMFDSFSLLKLILKGSILCIDN